MIAVPPCTRNSTLGKRSEGVVNRGKTKCVRDVRDLARVCSIFAIISLCSYVVNRGMRNDIPEEFDGNIDIAKPAQGSGCGHNDDARGDWK